MNFLVFLSSWKSGKMIWETGDLASFSLLDKKQRQKNNNITQKAFLTRSYCREHRDIFQGKKNGRRKYVSRGREKGAYLSLLSQLCSFPFSVYLRRSRQVLEP